MNCPRGTSTTCTGASSSSQCVGKCSSDRAAYPCSEYASCTNVTEAPGFRCSCNACYTGAGTCADGSVCVLPAPTITGVGRQILLPDSVNTVRAGVPILFTLSFGCNTGADILRPAAGFPRLVNVSCNAFVNNMKSPLVQPLPQGVGLGAWTYNARTFAYNFNFNTNRTWAGLCAAVEFPFKQGGGQTLRAPWFRFI
jgi:hypothetical protein